MKLILARSRRNDVIAISGMWMIRNRLKIVRFVPDAFIIYPGEILLEIENNNDTIDLVRTLKDTEKMISLSTTLARLREVIGAEKRVFVTASAIVEDFNNLARAAYCGGADGILNDIGKLSIDLEDSTIQIIETNTEDSQYAAVRAEELSKLDIKQVKNMHGIIIYMNFKPSLNMIRYLRERCIILYGKSRIIIALPHIYLNYNLLKRSKDIIYGIALTSFGVPINLTYVEYDKTMLMYRCPECRRDMITENVMRKCPRCGQRLIELLKEPSERYFRYTSRELRYIFMNMLKIVEKGIVVDYYGY